MGKKRKRRKRKLTALAERLINLAIDILSAILSGLITAAIVRWLNW